MAAERRGERTMETTKITETSKALFLAYAQDAGNWSGMPLVDGNVAGNTALRGNLTQLKRAGLIRTARGDKGSTWVLFTPAGIAYAATLGVDLSWIG
jgi:hypothetical protein